MGFPVFLDITKDDVVNILALLSLDQDKQGSWPQAPPQAGPHWGPGPMGPSICFFPLRLLKLKTV